MADYGVRPNLCTIGQFPNRFVVVGSNLPCGDMQTSPQCARWPCGRRLPRGRGNKHKSRSVNRNLPASASLWRWQGGGIFARGAHTFRVCPHVPIVSIQSRPVQRNPRVSVFLFCAGREEFLFPWHPYI